MHSESDSVVQIGSKAKDSIVNTLYSNESKSKVKKYRTTLFSFLLPLIIISDLSIIDMGLAEYEAFCNYLDEELNQVKNKEDDIIN